MTGQSAAIPEAHGGGRAPVSRGTIAVHIVLLAYVVVAIGPVLLIVLNSLKTQAGIFEGPLAPPNADTFSVEGYVTALTAGAFPRYFFNSFVVTGATMLITTVCAVPAAYALAEYKVRLAVALLLFFMIGIMLPIRLGTVTLIQMMVGLKIYDTLIALILVYTAMSLPVAVALLTSYFRSVPQELKESARIDGAGELRTLRVVLPLVRPGVAAVVAISALPIWNDLWFPLILAPAESTKTVTLGAQLFLGQYVTNWNAVLAALSLAILPVMVLYLIFSRQLIRGITSGAVK